VIYDIRHVTTYAYESPVSFARCSLRLQPRDGDGQSLVSHEVILKPVASERIHRTDFFGTQTENIVIEIPHRALSIDSSARVNVTRSAPEPGSPSPRWEDVREAAYESNSIAASSPAGYLFESPLVTIQLPITEYAALSFPAGRDILTGVTDLMKRIRADFIFDTKATEILTPLADVFKKKRGVCQDFAHIMISGLRGIGLPAAYVSGYLRTTPPSGQPRLQGADATHAWVSAWCGEGLGWIGFDPTNALVVAEDHIILAIGRDYTDVSPVDGVIVGSKKQKLTVAVDVVPVD
jgi:transglutaminase-like putative cysteine protease